MLEMWDSTETWHPENVETANTEFSEVWDCREMRNPENIKTVKPDIWEVWVCTELKSRNVTIRESCNLYIWRKWNFPEPSMLKVLKLQNTRIRKRQNLRRKGRRKFAHWTLGRFWKLGKPKRWNRINSDFGKAGNEKLSDARNLQMEKDQLRFPGNEKLCRCWACKTEKWKMSWVALCKADLDNFGNFETIQVILCPLEVLRACENTNMKHQSIPAHGLFGGGLFLPGSNWESPDQN